MNDKLVERRGILTIGLAYECPDRQKGIHWALSLAHLRHYGPPIVSSKSSERDSSRISFDELLLVALGSLVRAWKAEESEISKIAAWLVVLWEGLTAEKNTLNVGRGSQDDVNDGRNGGKMTFAWIGHHCPSRISPLVSRRA